MEDHKGRILLANHPEGGALVTLLFPALTSA
jgi:nitrogen fixation/metabolism regulation signal transduction histidine kinase